MAGAATDRCGYTWPEDCERVDADDYRSDEFGQSCCFRETVPDADRCAWHADPNETDYKTRSALRDARVPSAMRERTESAGERLNGADVSGVEFPEGVPFETVSFRGAVLADASLADADLTGADLRHADLTDASLDGADLTDASLTLADLTDASLRDADLTDASLTLADLTGANLSGGLVHDSADLTDASLRDADLTDADLYIADLTDASLADADLTDAFLADADLTDASLFRADLTEADLNSADLTDADLENANLTRTNLFDADLRGAEFYGTITTDTQIDGETQFGDHYTDENGDVPLDDNRKARWCNRTIEDLSEENALTEPARAAFLRRRDLKREQVRAESRQKLHDSVWTAPLGDLWTHLRSGAWREEWWPALTTYGELRVAGSLMGYGERLGRVARAAAVVVLASTLLYPLLGVESAAGDRLTYPVPTGDAPFEFYAAMLDTLLTSLYFSVLTFTTLGFGDFQPTGLGRALATFEAGAGVTLFAMLVFVLGRRGTR